MLQSYLGKFSIKSHPTNLQQSLVKVTRTCVTITAAPPFVAYLVPILITVVVTDGIVPRPAKLFAICIVKVLIA